MHTIVDVIERSLEQGRSRTSFTYLEDGDNAAPALALSGLRHAAFSIAGALPPDGAVLVLLPQGLSFIKAFFACLYARAIAVPVAVPTKSRGLEHIRAIVADASITVGITHRSTLLTLQKWFGDDYFALGVHWLFIEDLAEDGPPRFESPAPERLAFLQYTSGSTGNPKAVMVTHANIMANSSIIRQCFQNTEDSVSVCWLPSFHDMGLIDGVIQPVFSGFRSILMSPTHFLQRPARWLTAITRYGATYSGGPNFAYDFCVERIKDEELSGFDLRTLRCLYNGAEPIRAATIRRFVDRFAPAGFDETKVFTCYGLAEATLAVSTSRLGTAPAIAPGASEVVSCGRVLGDTQLRILDPHTRIPCAAEQVGEICIAGTSVTAGYFNRPEMTADTFVDIEGTVFLRSGDLGFVANDELFVTGRIKDLIIIRGKNHYPQDIEHSVTSAHASLQPNACAAFSVDLDGEERLVLVGEIKRTFLKAAYHANTVNAIRAEVGQAHGLIATDILLVSPGSVPKTTSGKIRRSSCRQLWLDGRFNALASLRDANLRAVHLSSSSVA